MFNFKKKTWNHDELQGGKERKKRKKNSVKILGVGGKNGSKGSYEGVCVCVEGWGGKKES